MRVRITLLNPKVDDKPPKSPLLLVESKIVPLPDVDNHLPLVGLILDYPLMFPDAVGTC